MRSPGLSLRADCLVAEAEIQRWVGTPDSAVAYAQRALRMLEDSSATLNTRYGGMLNDLATYLGVAGRNREAIPVFRRILALLDSLGLDDSQQHVVVAFNLAVSLRDMGEWASARDVIASELRRGGPSGENVSTMLKYLYGTTTSALAMNDTALLWLTRAGRDTSLRSASLVAGIPAGLALVRLRQGQRAAARPLVRQALDAYRRVPDRPQSQANRVLLQARARVAEGDVRRALAGLRADLRWMGYFDGKQERYMGPILVAAAEEALALGELDAAERFARSAREVAAVDSLALRQSAVVGEASLVHARVSRAKGDTSAAGTWAELSIPALAFGYGGDHPRTVEARALLDTLRRTR